MGNEEIGHRKTAGSTNRDTWTSVEFHKTKPPSKGRHHKEMFHILSAKLKITKIIG